MALSRISDEAFIDLDQLSLAIFTGLDSNPKAVVRLNSGDEYQLAGSSASALHSVLNRQEDIERDNAQPILGRDAEMPADNSEEQPTEYEFAPLTRNKPWFFKADAATGRKFFMALVNAKGSCSLRMFDADSGIAFPKQYRSGNYQDQFKDFINGARELTLPHQPNLERDCKERLPEDVLAYLLQQLP